MNNKPALSAGAPNAGRGSVGFATIATLAYTLLILYGSLFPFTHWTEPTKPLFSFLVTRPSYDRADLVQNLLVYLPLGLLMTVWLNGRRRFAPALAWATVAGTLLSFAIESIQQYLPDRVPSLSDLVLNSVGTLFGGLLAIFVSRDTLTGQKLAAHRDRLFLPGRTASVAIAVLGLWTLSQTSPLVPSLDPAHMRHGFALLKQAYLHPELFDSAKFATYTLYVLGLGLLAVNTVKPERPAVAWFATLVLLVLCSKILVVTRQLAAEALLGGLAAIVALVALRRLGADRRAFTGFCLLATGFAVFELAPVPGASSATPTFAFNWVPFAGQMQSLSGLENILELLWPFMAMACFWRAHSPPHRRAVACLFGSVLVLAYLFGMEWWQQYLPGRYGDITQVALGFVGWLLPWWIGRGKPAARRQAPLASVARPVPAVRKERA